METPTTRVIGLAIEITERLKRHDSAVEAMAALPGAKILFCRWGL